MGVDNNLYNSLNNNPNLSEQQKKMLYSFLIQVKVNVFDMYIPDYNFDNILPLVESLKIVEGNENDCINYDKNNNVFVLGKSPDNQEYYTYKSLIELSSQRYDEETSTYTSGLVVEKDGKVYGKKLNSLLIDNLITINTGIILKDVIDDEVTSEIKPSDVMIGCFERMVSGAENLVQLFVTGNGKRLLELLKENLGEENAIRVLDDNANTERLSLCAQACELRRERSIEPRM